MIKIRKRRKAKLKAKVIVHTGQNVNLECLRYSIQLVNILEGFFILLDGPLIGVVFWQFRPDTQDVHFEAAAEVVDPDVDVI